MIDVQLPIIGADFLANFNLLVDYRNHRLLNTVRSLSTSAQTASTRFQRIKTIAIGTPENSSPNFQITSAPRESRRCTITRCT